MRMVWKFRDLRSFGECGLVYSLLGYGLGRGLWLRKIDSRGFRQASRFSYRRRKQTLPSNRVTISLRCLLATENLVHSTNIFSTMFKLKC
jgi:hypothetical protein